MSETIKPLGLDIGTFNLIIAYHNTENKVVHRRVRDCFLPIPQDRFIGKGDLGKTILDDSKANYIFANNTYYVLGETAYDMSILLNEDLNRPMAAGILNAKEPLRIAMVRELINGLVPKNMRDLVYFSVPAEPLTKEFRIDYHQQILENILTAAPPQGLGFKKARPMTEGMAVIYSELQDNQFTGLGLSCGAGMVNVALAFKGIEIFSYALTQAGDWIDQQAAQATNTKASKITAIKEEGIDINAPLLEMNEYQQAIAVQYNTLIKNIIRGMAYQAEQTDQTKLSKARGDLPIVIAGGTSLVEGFPEKLSEWMEKEGRKLPFNASQIRRAKSPLNCVSQGLLFAAEREVTSE